LVEPFSGKLQMVAVSLEKNELLVFVHGFQAQAILKNTSNRF